MLTTNSRVARTLVMVSLAGVRHRRHKRDGPRHDGADQHAIHRLRRNGRRVDDHGIVARTLSPRIDASSISTTCTIGRSFPAARAAAVICSIHPGFVVAMISGDAAA